MATISNIIFLENLNRKAIKIISKTHKFTKIHICLSIVAFTCTAGGCRESELYGPFLTQPGKC